MAGAMSDESPWPQTVRWTEAKAGPLRLDLVADTQTLERVAGALDLPALKNLRADLTVRAWLDGLEIGGRITAVATRVCGVSLELFDEPIDEPLSVRVVPDGSPHAPSGEGGEVIVDPEAEDPPDVLLGDTIDVGAYVVEHLALSLDPFPRKPGAVFETPDIGAPASPFAVLARLKTPREN